MKYFIRYGEIGVKSPKTRRKFENRLMKNIKTGLECDLKNYNGRIILNTNQDDETVQNILNRVFGIVSYSPYMKP